MKASYMKCVYAVNKNSSNQFKANVVYAVNSQPVMIHPFTHADVACREPAATTIGDLM